MAKDGEVFNLIFERGNFLKNVILSLFKPLKTEIFKETIPPKLNNCICCGLCVEVCPTNAISIFKFRDIICESCGLCVEICQNSAIKKDRFYVDPQKCTKCGYCVMFCTIPLIKNEIPVKKVPEVTLECNNCGLCIYQCLEKAIQFKNGEIVINPKICKICLKCVEFCPLNALLSPNDSVKSKIINVDLNSCIFCKDCEEICPIKK
ncbi:4Fe-4S ferredoxin iron-sulfur binding domain protein [Methanococcus vannielii SB]|uniref:4Fe-4S ferredoxin iron-sulfur binding domain protein n=1 Tax=Methanococcus vannielii (strain ATCC 35089 / DSM 1224 / JCM 13029 / OCM 148 / SB) TaxID=406327 RepID=A6UR92_METVS|nr:4Fe-4S binding protein [Methanococcus vannielii]ABR55014.1 4Fe-4S ferredoxin iron-sulfur binding domain protein [Methanococcus vannielii SB]